MQQMALNQFNYPNQEVYVDPVSNYKYTDPLGVQMNVNNDIPPKKLLYLKGLEVVGYQRGQPVKGNRINLAVTDPDLSQAHDQFDPYPRYSYSYGVHVSIFNLIEIN